MFNTAFASAFADAATTAAARTSGTPTEMAHRQLAAQATNVVVHHQLRVCHTRRDAQQDAAWARSTFLDDLAQLRRESPTLLSPAQRIADDLAQFTGQHYDVTAMAQDHLAAGAAYWQVAGLVHNQMRAHWDNYVAAQRGDSDDIFVVDLLGRH